MVSVLPAGQKGRKKLRSKPASPPGTAVAPPPSRERVEVLEKALHDIEGKCADTIAGRINYRAGDLQSIARAALGEKADG